MDALIKINDLSGGYTGDLVVKEVSFSVKPGDFLGIIGPNGSGKSTLLKLMSKVLTPKCGSIVFDGRSIADISLKSFCQKVSFVPQDTMINFSFTVEEIVLMGRIPHLGRMQMETKKDHAAVIQAMTLTDTLAIKDRPIDELSAGERQRVVVARALAQEPALLFLDEPTSHLDIGHQVQLLDLLKKLNRKNGLAIVMVVHELNLAAEYCDRLILLNKGRIFRQGSVAEVLTYQNIETVYKTTVVVKDNPISSKPYVILVSEEDKACRQN